MSEPQYGAGARCSLRASLTHLGVRSLPCSLAPSPRRPCGAQGKTFFG